MVLNTIGTFLALVAFGKGFLAHIAGAQYSKEHRILGHMKGPPVW